MFHAIPLRTTCADLHQTWSIRFYEIYETTIYVKVRVHTGKQYVSLDTSV